MTYIIIENDTHLPILLEYWEKEKNYKHNLYSNYKNKIKPNAIELNAKIVEQYTKVKIYSINKNWYISSIFSEEQEEYKKLWMENRLENEMIAYINNSNTENKFKIEVKSETFNVDKVKNEDFNEVSISIKNKNYILK
jgi:hypothetical protein